MRCCYKLLFACSFALYHLIALHSEEVRPTVRFEHLGPFGGDVRSLLIDSRNPEIVYLGSSNGRIFKSQDSGKSWTALYPGIGQNGYVIDTLVQHPGKHDRIFAGSWDLHSNGGGLFESRDGGLTWIQITLPAGSSAVRGFSICKSHPEYMIVGTLSGVFVTEDGGRIWENVGGSKLAKAESVAIDPNDSRFLYVGTWRLSYKSTDFGKTWTLADKGMPLDSDVFSIEISSRDPQTIYASACSGVYRSSNGAGVWKRLKVHPKRLNIRAQVVHIDPTDPHLIYTGTTEGLYGSRDSGHTWTRLTSANTVVNTIQVDPRNNRHILIGTEYQGVLASNDGGKTWNESNKGFVHRRISWIVPDPRETGHFLAGAVSGSGGMYAYDNSTNSWTLSQIEPRMRIFSFLVLPNDRGSLAGTSQGIYWQAYGSNTWEKLKGSIGRQTIYSLVLDPHNPVVYAGTDRGVYRTTLEAMNFRMPPNNRLSPQVWCILASETSPGLIFAGSSLGVLRSWDQGTTWSVVSSFGLPERTRITSLAISPSNKDHLYAGTSAGLFDSMNGGIHWRRVEDNRLTVDIAAIIFLDDSGNGILAADNTHGGMFYSKNAGLDWNKISLPQNESPAYCLVRDPEQPSRIYVGTRTDGVYVLHMR